MINLKHLIDKSLEHKLITNKLIKHTNKLEIVHLVEPNENTLNQLFESQKNLKYLDLQYLQINSVTSKHFIKWISKLNKILTLNIKNKNEFSVGLIVNIDYETIDILNKIINWTQNIMAQNKKVKIIVISMKYQ